MIMSLLRWVLGEAPQREFRDGEDFSPAAENSIVVSAIMKQAKSISLDYLREDQPCDFLFV
jgi:hypothetical protein